MRPEDFVIGQERTERLRGLMQEHEEQFSEGEAEAYDEQIAEVRVAQRSHHDDVLAAVREIFADRDGRPMTFDHLELSVQERSALESLRSARVGKDHRTHTFVFAEQRREKLEQALAALQPILTLDVNATQEFRDSYDELVERVSELREHLADLEDAQDEELLQHIKAAAEQGQDDGDKADDDSDEDDAGATAASVADERGAAATPSALVGEPGEPAVERGPTVSTLTDPPPSGAAAATSAAATAETLAGARPEAAAEPNKGGVLARLGRVFGRGGPGGKDGDSGG
jgi:hypothetical protein